MAAGMIVSRLKLAVNEKAEVVLVCFKPVCVFSSTTVRCVFKPPFLWPRFSNDDSPNLISK